MTNVVKPPGVPIWRFLIALSIAACLLQSQASAQTNGVLSVLKQYQGDIAKMRAVSGKLLWPKTYTIECFGGEIDRLRYVVDFRSTRESLNSVLQQAEQYV